MLPLIQFDLCFDSSTEGIGIAALNRDLMLRLDSKFDASYTSIVYIYIWYYHFYTNESLINKKTYKAKLQFFKIIIMQLFKRLSQSSITVHN